MHSYHLSKDNKGSVGILILIGIFVIILVLGVGAYFLFKDKVSINNSEEMYDLYLKFEDLNKTSHPGSYLIALDDGRVFKGDVKKDEYETVSLPTNHTFTIYNTNTPDFYTASGLIAWQIESSSNRKMIFDLHPIGNLTFDGDQNILILKAHNGSIRKINVCLTWSSNVISVVLKGYSEMEIPQRLNNKVNKCYKVDTTIPDGENITIKYEYSKVLDGEKIYFYIIDSDKRYGIDNPVMEFEGQDIGKKDEILVFDGKSFKIN